LIGYFLKIHFFFEKYFTKRYTCLVFLTNIGKDCMDKISEMSRVNKNVANLISDTFQQGKSSSISYGNLCVVNVNPKFGNAGVKRADISVANGEGKPLTEHTVEVETMNGTKVLSISNVVTAQQKVRGAFLAREFSELVGLDLNTDWSKYNFPESEKFVGTEARRHLNELDAFIKDSLPKHLVGRFFFW
jgi:hypothetical protein